MCVGWNATARAPPPLSVIVSGPPSAGDISPFVASSADGSVLVYAARDGNRYVVENLDTAKTTRLQLHTGYTGDVSPALTRDGRILIYGRRFPKPTRDRLIIIDLATGRRPVLRGYSSGGPRISTTGRYITANRAHGDDEGILDLRTGHFTPFPHAPRGSHDAGALALSADGLWAVYGQTARGGVTQCFLFSRVTRASRLLGTCANAVAISADGERVLFSGGLAGRTSELVLPSGQVAPSDELFERTTRKRTRVPGSGSQAGAPGPTLTDDGATLAFACDDGSVYLYSPATSTYAQVVSGFAAEPGVVHLAPSGGAVFVAGVAEDATTGRARFLFERASTAAARSLGTDYPASCLSQPTSPASSRSRSRRGRRRPAARGRRDPPPTRASPSAGSRRRP
jgi:hypothetical protein